MKDYYLLWTYEANYSRCLRVTAESPEHAIHCMCGFYSDDFKKRATIFVFDHPPALVSDRGEVGKPDAFGHYGMRD